MVRRYPDKNKKIAGVIIANPLTAKILLLQKHSGRWDLPKGHVEPGEKKYDAAVREAWEETGLEDLEVFKNISITFPSKSMLFFFLGFHHGEEDEVYISDEHADFVWVKPSQAVRAFGSGSDFSKIIKAMCVLL